MSLRRFLNKNINCFLKQSPAENILPKSQLKKQNRKKRFVPVSYQSQVDNKYSQSRLSTSGFTWFSKAKQAETQVIREFLKRTGLEETRRTQSISPQKGGGAILPSLLRSRHSSPSEQRGKTISVPKSSPIDAFFGEQNAMLAARSAARKEFDGWETAIEASSDGRSSTECVAISAAHVKNSTLYKSKSQAPNALLPSSKTPTTEKNVSVIFSIEQIRNLLAAKRIERQTRSELRNQLLESRKIRLLYGGLSNQQLRKNIQRAKRLPGNASDNLLILLESRLDVVLQRCSFFPSIRTARQSVIHKQIHVNSKMVSVPGYQLQPGDIVQLEPLRRKQLKSSSLLRLNIDGSPLFPNRLKWEFSVPPSMLYSLLQLESFLSASILLSLIKNTSNQCTVQNGNTSEFCSEAQSDEYFLQNWEGETPRFSISIEKENLKQSECRLSNLEKISFLTNRLIKESELYFLMQRKTPFFFDFFSKNTIFGTDLHFMKSVNTPHKARRLTSQRSIEERREPLIAPFAFDLERKMQSTFSGKKKDKIGSFPEILSPSGKEVFSLKREEVFSLKEKGKQLFLRNEEIKSFTKTNRNVLQNKNPLRHHYSGKGVTLNLLSKLYVQKEDKDIKLSTLESDALQREKNGLSRPRKMENDRALSQRKPSYTFSSGWRVSLPWALQANSLETVYNTYSYWLEVKKKLTNLPKSRDVAHIKNLNTFLKHQSCSQDRRIKPLHLEISYQSCSAIFLYAPQRIYLPTLIDLDLLIKTL